MLDDGRRLRYHLRPRSRITLPLVGRKSSDGFGNHPVDVPGIGDEAWADRGRLLGSINVIARGHWMRISGSQGFGKKPLDALPVMARQAIGRLP